MIKDLITKPVKLLVTHQNPDPDAVGACWLLMKYGGRKLEGAQFYFVPSGSVVSDAVLKQKEVEREETVHVDTGLGVFDHHQADNQARDSATWRVNQYLIKADPNLAKDEALKRVVRLINDNDHFAACWWPEADHDRYVLMFEEILKGLRQARGFSDREVVEFGMICLDGIYVSMKQKVSAEAELALGQKFESRWGQSLAIENNNDEVIRIAQKRGFNLVVRKEADKGHIRIKVVPERGLDLTPLYEVIKKRDRVGTWFFHPSKTMLINGSRHNNTHVPSPLTLDEVVTIIKSI
ncbi:hypothetical protein A2W24_06955 [Microgenomates group bacterium RBG_16_45_19]|nr:MAG: hypothetical protein A2W24_06955 [Microgenomates group bacterium RBG_16_45_19]